MTFIRDVRFNYILVKKCLGRAYGFTIDEYHKTNKLADAQHLVHS